MRARFAISALLVSCLSVAAVPTALGQGAERDHANWWIQTYGVADAARDPRVGHAIAIFERVSAAADKRAGRLPRLHVIDANERPLALAIRDGSIILSRAAIAICYEGVSERVGDTRVAFVLSHELAHLANDDFWHVKGFGTLEAFDISSVEERHQRERQEFEADAKGALYTTFAGYDPSVLLSRPPFFESWERALRARGLVPTEGHPEAAARASLITLQLFSIAQHLDYFRFGVRLYQLGRYEDALLLLERFRDQYPGREVLNNIGLAHYQLAARILGECDGRLVVRFKLPALVDPTTRARRLRSTGQASECYGSERYLRHYREAERNFREAAEMDPDYFPAHINLLSLYALAERAPAASVEAGEAKRLRPEDPRALGGGAIALYLYGQQSGLETADAVVEELEGLIERFPGSPELAYNLAAILSERRRVQAATAAYRNFLALEPRGIHADAARDYVGETDGPPAPSRNVPTTPFPLGPLAAEAEVEVEDFVIGAFRGKFLRLPRGSALAIDATVELVEERLDDDEIMNVDEAISRHGAPVRRIETASGAVLLYATFALVTEGGTVVERFYFGEHSG